VIILKAEVEKMIERDYVEGYILDGKIHYPSITEVADKYDLSDTIVRNRCRSKNWDAARKAFMEKIEADRKLERAAKRVELLAEIDDTCLKLARAGLSYVAMHFNDRRADGIDSITLKNLATAAEKWQKIACNSLGVPIETVAVVEKMDESEIDERIKQAAGILRKAGYLGDA
jgi:hypothetical protein